MHLCINNGLCTSKHQEKVVYKSGYEQDNPSVGIGLTAIPNEKVYKKTVVLPGFKARQPISYVIRDNLAIYEGDIVLGSASNVVDPKPDPHPIKRDFSEFGNVSRKTQPLVSRISDRIIDRNWLWPHGIIPYEISRGFSPDERQAILDAKDELNELTNLNIVPRNGQDHYVTFKKKVDLRGAGWSRVGRQKKSQAIKLSPNASKNTVIHELLHTAGIWHEQSRSDMDGVKYNFDKHSSSGYKITPYDQNSIMHYGAYAFSKVDADGNPLPTIVDARTNAPISTGSGLSAIDIDGINTLYENDKADFITPPFTSTRFVKTTIIRVIGHSQDGGIKKSGIDYYMKNETGPGWDWRPGKKGNPTEKFKSGTVEERDNWITPNWQFRYTIPRNEEHAKVWLKLRDDDGLARNSRSDETIDINPFPGIKGIELYINTLNGNIFLGDIDGARKDENYIGQVGEELTLQGFDRGHKAEVQFKIEID